MSQIHKRFIGTTHHRLSLLCFWCSSPGNRYHFFLLIVPIAGLSYSTSTLFPFSLVVFFSYLGSFFVDLVVASVGSGYRWLFMLPGPAQVWALPSPLFTRPCLTRPYVPGGHAVLAHGLPQQPRHEATGLFRAGPARHSPTLQHRLGRSKPTNRNAHQTTPNFTSKQNKRSHITYSQEVTHKDTYYKRSLN